MSALEELRKRTKQFLERALQNQLDANQVVHDLQALLAAYDESFNTWERLTHLPIRFSPTTYGLLYARDQPPPGVHCLSTFESHSAARTIFRSKPTLSTAELRELTALFSEEPSS